MADEPASSQETQANPKAVVGALVVIGVAALILGSFHILNSIKSPFKVITPNSNTSLAAITEQDRKLQSQDTDGDTVNDYEELNIRQTSPFLKDSDSDGIDDAAEIAAGTDPNCPKGKDCGLVLSPGTNGNSNGSTTTNTSAVTTDAAFLRKTLKEAGAPAYVVDSADDATLLRLYNETVGTSSDGTTSNANVDDRQLISELKNLSVAEMRSLLQTNGVDSASLAKIDDATLKQIFSQAVDEEVAQ